MAITGDESGAADFVAALKDWLGANWDPDLTVGAWWERLGLSGWAAPGLPETCHGKGLSAADAVRVQQAIVDGGALGPPGGLGMMLAAPTIATTGTSDQRERYVRAIVTGAEAWCQLFSEPGAGSDLAGLQTRAQRDGNGWVVSGQKVWTSGGQVADLGMLLARTNPDAPKHQGLTYFAFDMRQPGVEVRPLREMTGRSLFNEVFITEARVGDDAIIGGLNNGWAVANTTLAFERASLGAGGGGGGAGAALAGTLAGDLGRRAGDLVRATGRGGSGTPGGMAGTARLLQTLARQLGVNSDPLVRQDLARLHILTEIGRYLTLRQRALQTQGGDIPGLGNLAKLSMSRILRLSRDLGLGMLGGRGALHAYRSDGGTSLAGLPGGDLATLITEMALFAQGPSIYGGTDEIQHNIIGERVLGLPREPGTDRSIPFRDLPRN
jgi:alkylation response protein AidB-like acyl-CoA dehydrogenase